MPGALADVVADGVAEDAGKRLVLGEVFGPFAYDYYQLALVLDSLGRVLWNDDRLAVGGEGVAGPLADVGSGRHGGGRQAQDGIGHPDVVCVVEARGVERGRDDGDQEC